MLNRRYDSWSGEARCRGRAIGLGDATGTRSGSPCQDVRLLTHTSCSQQKRARLFFEPKPHRSTEAILHSRARLTGVTAPSVSDSGSSLLRTSGYHSDCRDIRIKQPHQAQTRQSIRRRRIAGGVWAGWDSVATRRLKTRQGHGGDSRPLPTIFRLHKSRILKQNSDVTWSVAPVRLKTGPLLSAIPWRTREWECFIEDFQNRLREAGSRITRHEERTINPTSG